MSSPIFLPKSIAARANIEAATREKPSNPAPPIESSSRQSSLLPNNHVLAHAEAA